MELRTIYKLISGSSSEVEQVLNLLAKDDWRPVTMSCFGHPAVLTVILENKIVDEARLDLAGAIADETTGGATAEEIQ
jgi:hypothetical protein